mgnify:CR=1 FL=1
MSVITAPVRSVPVIESYRTVHKIFRTNWLHISPDSDIIKVNQIMSITATELKSNLGKYLLLAATEDIFITRNGKVVAKLSNPHQDRVDIAKSLFGILPADVTLEEAKEERLNRI